MFATLLIISLIGVSELYKVVKIEKAPLGIVGYIGVVAYYFLIRAQKKEDLMMFAIILLILVMAVYVFAFPKYVSEQVMTAYFGVFLCGDYVIPYLSDTSVERRTFPRGTCIFMFLGM